MFLRVGKSTCARHSLMLAYLGTSFHYVWARLVCVEAWGGHVEHQVSISVAKAGDSTFNGLQN